MRPHLRLFLLISHFPRTFTRLGSMTVKPTNDVEGPQAQLKVPRATPLVLRVEIPKFHILLVQHYQANPMLKFSYYPDPLVLLLHQLWDNAHARKNGNPAHYYPHPALAKPTQPPPTTSCWHMYVYIQCDYFVNFYCYYVQKTLHGGSSYGKLGEGKDKSLIIVNGEVKGRGGIEWKAT